MALDTVRATFVFVEVHDETESAVRTWGAQHAVLWTTLADGCAVEVIAVGRNPVRLAAADRMLVVCPRNGFTSPACSRRDTRTPRFPGRFWAAVFGGTAKVEL